MSQRESGYKRIERDRYETPEWVTLATFAKKLVLTKRIVWFDAPGAAPSFNHAWYIWDHRHTGAPTLAYGP